MELRFTDLHKTVPPTAVRSPSVPHTSPFTLRTPVTWGFTLASPALGQAKQFRGKDGSKEKGGNEATHNDSMLHSGSTGLFERSNMVF